MLTAVIQSSSASVGILQALSVTGAVTYANAVPIIMGQNIGTCITALLSSVGANKSAKRAAAVHLYFNIIGVIVFCILFYSAKAVLNFSFINDPVSQVGIAVVHTAFNVTATVIILPFSNFLVKLACMTVKDKENETNAEDSISLDERFFAVPAVAVSHSEQVAVKMFKISNKAVTEAISVIKSFSNER